MNRIQIALKEIRRYYPLPIKARIVGSTFISGRKDSDVDVLILSTENHFDSSWEIDGHDEYPTNSNFSSLKKRVDGVLINALLTPFPATWEDWVMATEVCRFLHLMGAAIPTTVVHGIHEIIMDGGTSMSEYVKRA